MKKQEFIWLWCKCLCSKASLHWIGSWLSDVGGANSRKKRKTPSVDLWPGFYSWYLLFCLSKPHFFSLQILFHGGLLDVFSCQQIINLFFFFKERRDHHFSSHDSTHPCSAGTLLSFSGLLRVSGPCRGAAQIMMTVQMEPGSEPAAPCKLNGGPAGTWLTVASQTLLPCKL